MPIQAMKAYRGSRCMAPVIPNFVARWGWRVKNTLQWLYPRVRGILPGPQNRSRRFEAGIRLLHVPGFEQRTVQPISQSFGVKVWRHRNVWYYMYCLTHRLCFDRNIRLVFEARHHGQWHVNSNWRSKRSVMSRLPVTVLSFDQTFSTFTHLT